MVKAVEFGLLAVSLLVILGLVVVGPGAYSRGAEEGDLELDPEAETVKSSQL